VGVGGNAYVATAIGIFESRDGGEFTALPALPALVRRLLVTGGNVLFAATNDGLFRCPLADACVRVWQRVESLPPIDVGAMDAGAGGRTLFVSDFRDGGVFRSDDAGGTWQKMPTTGLRSDRLWTIATDPRSPERVLAASITGGLHRLDTSTGGAPNVAAR